MKEASGGLDITAYENTAEDQKRLVEEIKSL